MRSHNIVNVRQLTRIVYRAALSNGLQPPRQDEIASMYFATNAKRLPIIKRCENGMVWVDRYYAAYQIDDGDVRYVYISEHHISEEVAAYRQAAKQRNIDVRMPKDILACFKKAKASMAKSGELFWVDSKFRDNPELVGGLNMSEHSCVVECHHGK